MKKFTAVFVLILSMTLQVADACTIFSLYPQGKHWVGRTFDWSYGHALVYNNKRGVTKTSVKLLLTDVTSSWTSKYGSISFNQFGREFPNGGMNEAGLMIDALELESSIYLPIDSRASFNELQFIQYVLDNFSTIKDLKAELQKIRIAPVGSKLHYFTCDVDECMTIEYINGALVTTDGADLKISGLANSTYAEHVDYAKDFVTFGGDRPVVLDSKKSLDRFVRSNYNAKSVREIMDPTQDVFAFLDDVGSVNNRWQIIYKQDEKTITFRTKSQFDKVRKIDLKQFNFDCRSVVTYFDVDSAEATGDINNAFKSFDAGVNFASIKKSVELQKLPAPLAGRLAVYPNETACN